MAKIKNAGEPAKNGEISRDDTRRMQHEDSDRRARLDQKQSDKLDTKR